MKKKYLLLTILLVSATWSCKTKKSTTDFKQTETENVSVTDNSVVKKNLTTDEKTGISKTETTADKSFFEAWMEIKSDEATFEDKAGNKWTFKNPQVNQKSSQTNDVNQSNQIAVKKEKATEINENKQNNVAVSNNRQIKTDLLQKDSSKGREPVWLYVVGAVLVSGFGYLILKRFGLV